MTDTKAVSSYKGKTYQSHSPFYNVCLDNDQNPNDKIVVTSSGIISFIGRGERLTNLIFGEFNSTNPQMLARFRVREVNPTTGQEGKERPITAQELEAMIENSKSFKDCQEFGTVGSRGVWLKEEREKWLKEQAGSGAADPVAIVTAQYAKLSDTILKSIIEEAKKTYPQKAEGESDEAYHAKLVQIVVELQK